MVTPTSPSQTASSSFLLRMIGANTMTVVRVEATMARPTSRVPRTDAASGRSPRCCRRLIDSSTTTALSTSMPTPSIKPIMVNTFRERPLRKRKTQVPRMDRGMAMETTSVMPTRRRNRYRIRMARIEPKRPPWSKLRNESVI